MRENNRIYSSDQDFLHRLELLERITDLLFAPLAAL